MTRRLVSTLALVLATTGIPLMTAGSAQAIPACNLGYQCTYTYYTSAAHDDEPVGEISRGCSGGTDSWGRTTRYVVVTQARCS